MTAWFWIAPGKGGKHMGWSEHEQLLCVAECHVCLCCTFHRSNNSNIWPQTPPDSRSAPQCTRSPSLAPQILKVLRQVGLEQCRHIQLDTLHQYSSLQLHLAYSLRLQLYSPSHYTQVGFLFVVVHGVARGSDFATHVTMKSHVHMVGLNVPCHIILPLIGVITKCTFEKPPT